MIYPVDALEVKFGDLQDSDSDDDDGEDLHDLVARLDPWKDHLSQQGTSSTSRVVSDAPVASKQPMSVDQLAAKY